MLLTGMNIAIWFVWSFALRQKSFLLSIHVYNKLLTQATEPFVQGRATDGKAAPDITEGRLNAITAAAAAEADGCNADMEADI